MGIAKSLRKANNLNQFAQGLGAVLNHYLGDKSMSDLMNAVTDVGKKMESRFQPQPGPEKINMMNNQLTDPFLQSPVREEAALNNVQNTPNTAINENAPQQSKGDIANFILSQIGKNVPADQLNEALTGLKLKRESLLPPETEKMDLFATDPTKDVFDEKTGKLIRPGKEKPEKKTKYRDFSQKGYWDVTDPDNPVWVPNKNYKPESTGTGDKYSDPTKLLGKVNEAIAKIQMMKKAKFNPKTGYFDVPDPYGVGFLEMTQDELTQVKNQVKSGFEAEALDLINSQGLQDAVKDIDQILITDPKTGKTRDRSSKNLDSALKKFLELNPDFKDSEDILRDYFRFKLL